MATPKRSTGLALLAMGMASFAGTTNGLLPAEAFWPALAASALGCIVFMRANRAHLEAADRRVERALNPRIRSKAAEEHAELQARTDGRRLAALAGERPAVLDLEEPIGAQQEILLSDVDSCDGSGSDGFVVSTDVSVPYELQQQASIADQIRKLDRLRADGVITGEEFAVAKAKLLG